MVSSTFAQYLNLAIFLMLRIYTVKSYAKLSYPVNCPLAHLFFKVVFTKWIYIPIRWWGRLVGGYGLACDVRPWIRVVLGLRTFSAAQLFILIASVGDGPSNYRGASDMCTLAVWLAG